MEVRSLIEKFKEENNIMNLDIITGMVVYGSRVNCFDNEASDLDVLLITNGKDCYKAGQVIDDVKIEMGIYSANKLLSLIYDDKKNNNRFFSSVFNTGLVEKNEENIVGVMRDFTNEAYVGRMEKRIIHPEVKCELHKLYINFKANENKIYEDYYYYNLLEIIRNTYIYIKNYSRLAFTKVYDLFNSSILNRYYQLKLPPMDFMRTFIIALSTYGYDARIKVVDELLRMIGIEPMYMSLMSDSFKVWDTSNFYELEYQIIYLRDKIKKVEDMLINNHDAKMYVYNVVLYRLRDLITWINNGNFDEASLDFQYANACETDDERIKALENLFSHITSKININCDNYLVKRM